MKKSRIIPIYKGIQNSRAGVVLVALAVALAIIFLRLFDVAILKHDHYSSLAYDQITTTSSLKAKRGTIYDSSMSVLATSKTAWRVFVFPKEIRKRSKKDNTDYADLIAKGLDEILNIGYDTLYKKISTASSLDVTLKKTATESEYEMINQLKLTEGLNELIYTEAQSVRLYPEGTLAAHLLGFSGSDGQGLYGLEYQYESLLSGTDGYYLYAKDASGIAIQGDYRDYVSPTDGADLITTIDPYLQALLEGIVERIRINHSVENRVTAVIMNNETGAILGMATSSPFDPNSPFELTDYWQALLDGAGYEEGSEEYKKLKTELLNEMWSNKAVSETYEPGSTFKIVTVAAALESGAATLNDKFSCNGFHTIGGWRIKCHKVTGHGSGFDLAYGLQMSCNPTMMTVAERIGADVFYDYVKRFGYFEKSGIDLPSEGNTIFHQEGSMGPTELATSSFGQRFKVTIINQLKAISAIANGGYLVEPYVVEAAIGANGEQIYTHTVKRTKILSEQTANSIADVLEKGVSGEGGAKNAYVEGYKIAAKTGTSQKFDVLDENGNSYLRIGSTVAFSPSDCPGISVIVVVDEPTSQVKYGSVVAAPYVSEIMASALPYLEYRSSVTPESYTVQNQVGKTSSEVCSALNKDGIEYKVIGNGDKIVAQSPPAGTVVYKGMTKILLYTEEQTSVRVPSLVGLSAAQAQTVASALGIELKFLGYADKGKKYTIASQDIPEGSIINKGEYVTVLIAALDHED